MQHWYTLPGIAVLLSAGQALAEPRHDICADLGTDFTWGISSFGPAEGWLEEARDTYGVDWSSVYIYVSVESNREALAPFLELKVNQARSVDALPVMTFYQLLKLAEFNAVGGAEIEKVRAVLESPTLMNQYLTGYVWLLDTLAAIGGPILVHVEPDSWGFMMWGFGIEGNDDASSVTAMVGSSGFAEVAGMDDDAGALGRAMVALRDAHAPEVRLGWHASNFRVGTRPEVVTSFYSSMGDWDVLVTEHPRNEADDNVWWEPWDAGRVEANLEWLSSLTSATGLPMLLWQLPVGTTDYHMLPAPGDDSVIERFAEAGVIGGMFAHSGTNGADPDTFRETGGGLSNVPPAGNPAGGTAADARTRLAAYFENPYALPAGSICGGGALQGSGGGEAGDGGAAGGGSSTDGGAASGGASSSGAGSGNGAAGEDGEPDPGGDGGNSAAGGNEPGQNGDSGDGPDGSAGEGGNDGEGAGAARAGSSDDESSAGSDSNGGAAGGGGCAYRRVDSSGRRSWAWLLATLVGAAVTRRRRSGRE